MQALAHLNRLLPGLQPLLKYRAADWPYDLRAGLSVAAVAIPIAIAYAQLAGFSPSTGLYASILPMVVYAFAGTSRQLIIGPDAATCAMLAAVIAPLAAGNSGLYLTYGIALTLLTGAFCLAASFLRLGGLADFLAKPIIIGLLNGVSLTILIGQVGKVLGSKPEATRFFKQLLEIPHLVLTAHWPTVVLSICCAAVMFFMPRYTKRVPASLATMIIAGLAAFLFGLDKHGVALIGPVAGGLPDLEWPELHVDVVGEIAASAAGLALVLFTSGMLTARSFAERNGYDIDVDREFARRGPRIRGLRSGQHCLGAVAGLCGHRCRFAHCGQRLEWRSHPAGQHHRRADDFAAAAGRYRFAGLVADSGTRCRADVCLVVLARFSGFQALSPD